MTTPKMSLIESYQETYGQGGGQKLRDLESMMRSMSLHVSTWFTDVYWLATACYGLLRLATACYGLLVLVSKAKQGYCALVDKFAPGWRRDHAVTV